jgi:hypothetical protein
MLTFAAAAYAMPSVSVQSFTYDQSDATGQGLIFKGTNTGANSLDTVILQLDSQGTASKAVLVVGGKSYTTYCVGGGGGKYFAAVQCKPPAGLLAPNTPFTITFSVSPAYPANETNVLMADDKSGVREYNFTGPTGSGPTQPPPPPPPPSCSTISLGPASLPGATMGQAYSQSISGSGGTAPYTFKLATGSAKPPHGVTLASNGTLSGTPTKGGAFPMTIVATDANGCTGSRDYTLNVAKAASTTAGTRMGAAKSNAFSLHPDLQTVRLRAHRHSFSLKFAWLVACSGGPGCKGTISFRPTQIMAGSKRLSSKKFQLRLKRRAFPFSGRAGNSRRGTLQIVVRSRRQLRALYGHTLVFPIVISRGGERTVKTVRVFVTRRGFLR